jgi:hypothetical protein
MRENTEIVGRGDADAGGTVVDAEGGVRGSRELRVDGWK